MTLVRGKTYLLPPSPAFGAINHPPVLGTRELGETSSVCLWYRFAFWEVSHNIYCIIHCETQVYKMDHRTS